MSINASRDERTWAMLCHMSAYSGYLTGLGFILGPLIVWLIKKDIYPLANDQGKESLNFQISCFIYYVVSAALCIILIGIPILVAVAFFHLIMPLVAGIRANDGEAYRYPLTIRIIQ